MGPDIGDGDLTFFIIAVVAKVAMVEWCSSSEEGTKNPNQIFLLFLHLLDFISWSAQYLISENEVTYPLCWMTIPVS